VQKSDTIMICEKKRIRVMNQRVIAGKARRAAIDLALRAA
jgi:hypothetical protein